MCANIFGMLKIQKNEVTTDLCVCSLAKHGMYKQKKECSVCEPLVNPRRACAARVTVLGLSVRRLANLAVQGTGRPMTATNRLRVARSLILIGRFS